MLTRVVPPDGTGPDGSHHVVVVLGTTGPFADELTARGVEVIELGMRPGRDVVRGLVRLVRTLRPRRPDVVLAWLAHASLLATLAAPLVGRPRLVWLVRTSLESMTGIPWHGRLTLAVLARLSRRPDAIAVNSRAGQRDHERIGYRPRRWVLVPNRFDPDEWRPDPSDRAAVRAELGLADDELAVVHVARVHPVKDHPTVLAAFARLVERAPRARLVCVGAGTESLVLAPAIADRVRLLGERGDVARLLRGMDLAVLGSLAEGLPNALGEAMASGLPCVTTDVGDAAALVGPTGRTCPPGDPVALAESLAALLALPAAERAALGRAARERVLAAHGPDVASAAYAGLWTDRA
jgi:glycosyltransferase involved in cell wall biosynthesis